MKTALAPRWWGLHLLAVVAVVAAGLLGWWQLGSWQASREAEARDLSAIPAVPLAEVIGPDDAFPGADVGRPVEVAGTWVPEGTTWIEGREHEGRVGWWMVTPLTVDGSGGSALPVVLGWVPDVAGSPAPPTGTTDLVASLQPTEGTGQVDTDPTDDVLPQLRIADVIQHVDQDLYSGYAVARDGVAGLPAGDLAQLPETSAFTGLRNLLYALEWWVFAGFAAFIWWRWVRDLVRDEQSAADPTDPVGPAGPPDPGDPGDPEPAAPERPGLASAGPTRRG